MPAIKVFSGVGISRKDLLFSLPPAPDIIKENVEITFMEDEKFLPVKKMIDKKFNRLFNKLLSLSEHGEKLKYRKTDLLRVVYNLVYQRILLHPHLSELLESLSNHSNSLSKKEIKNGLENFKIILEDVFEMPDIVLAAFEESSRQFEDKLNEATEKLSGSKKLKPGDYAYEIYMKFVDEMINNKITKYKVIKNYLNDNKHRNQSEKSLSNAFDSFLRNHIDEIKKKYRLSEKIFNEKFFPATLSKK